MRIKHYIYLSTSLLLLAASVAWGADPNLPPTRPLWDTNKLITNQARPLLTFSAAQDPEGMPVYYTVKISNSTTTESSPFFSAA